MILKKNKEKIETLDKVNKIEVFKNIIKKIITILFLKVVW